MRPAIAISGGGKWELRLELAAASVYGVLGMQLLAAVAGPGCATCAACGAFLIGRRPAKGKRVFCSVPACKREGGRLRKAAHDRRQRRRGAAGKAT